MKHFNFTFATAPKNGCDWRLIAAPAKPKFASCVFDEAYMGEKAPKYNPFLNGNKVG